MTWNNRTGNTFGSDDLVGFGDADEIPSARNLHLLKHCEMAGPSVDIGVWFAWGRLDRAFKPDWPVPGHPWTLGDPTYWTLQSAMSYATTNAGAFPSRMRGTSGHYLLGGVHMTDNPYPPFTLIKMITCTECGDDSQQLFRKLRDCFEGSACTGLDDEAVIKKLMRMLDRSPQDNNPRLVNVGPTTQGNLGEAYYVPWYVKCHPERYPGWYGKVDGRLM